MNDFAKRRRSDIVSDDRLRNACEQKKMKSQERY
jgi:hypothetical protein